jgi:predicted metal-dependent phosphoesterase TrpH
MIIDFHTHSHASDGALAPADLLAQAVAAGVRSFAITDHDTVAAYRTLEADCPELPEDFSLVTGTELSCVWSGVTVHVVGLGLRLDDPELRAGLKRQDAARQERAAIIARRLEERGMPGALAGARGLAGVSQIGRPHFAAWLVDCGHVRDLNKAFDKYLGSGKIGDVKSCWPQLAEVVGWIVSAGGTAVLAHPLKYKLTRMKLNRLIVDFLAAGGGALEVFSGRQSPEQLADLCLLAKHYGMPVSAGSDFHAPWDRGPSLGFDTARLPDFVELMSPAGGSATP